MSARIVQIAVAVHEDTPSQQGATVLYALDEHGRVWVGDVATLLKDADPISWDLVPDLPEVTP